MDKLTFKMSTLKKSTTMNNSHQLQTSTTLTNMIEDEKDGEREDENMFFEYLNSTSVIKAYSHNAHCVGKVLSNDRSDEKDSPELHLTLVRLDKSDTPRTTESFRDILCLEDGISSISKCTIQTCNLAIQIPSIRSSFTASPDYFSGKCSPNYTQRSLLSPMDITLPNNPSIRFELVLSSLKSLFIPELPIFTEQLTADIESQSYAMSLHSLMES
jgi:hypothetical protein